MPATPNVMVFRESRQRVRGPELKSALVHLLGILHSSRPPDRVLRALLRAGELECAVADSEGAVPLQPFSIVTDRLAEALLAPHLSCDCGGLIATVAEAATPEDLYVSPPEGFAYYALHPMAYVDVLAKIPSLTPRVAVVGIRTIGVTLSSVVAAAARVRGLTAERITVRPHGHPYNRRMKFSANEIDFIRRQTSQNANFLVVDEGPGLSGSTFLSVAEALVEAGVSRERIILVCAREPDFDRLHAQDGPLRARRFCWIPVSGEPRRPAAAETFIGGGQWRSHSFSEEAMWPPSWTTLERLKYLSADQSRDRWLYKFLGFGHYGERVFSRESQVSDAGFGPRPRCGDSGFASYPWLAAQPMSPGDLCPDVIDRLAAYCAFRVEAFACDFLGLGPLEQMADHNARELGLEAPLPLRLERPVLADGRMQPYEWLRAMDGPMLKTDSGAHGDDHFYPGVTDIAWDLAGAIVEWNMNPGQADGLLRAYRRWSGDDASARMADFITAYALFRCAYCRMAANALLGSDESDRLKQAAARYSALLSRASAQTLFLSAS